jgi:hypothetical protein
VDGTMMIDGGGGVQSSRGRMMIDLRELIGRSRAVNQPVQLDTRALDTREGTRAGSGFGGPRRTEVSAGVCNPQLSRCSWDRSTKTIYFRNSIFSQYSSTPESLDTREGTSEYRIWRT